MLVLATLHKKGGWIDSYCCEVESSCFSVREDEKLVGLFLFIKKIVDESTQIINGETMEFFKMLKRNAL